MKIEDQDLIYYNQRGLIPGPDETEEEYLKRVKYCLSLRDNITQELSPHIPISPEDLGDPGILLEPCSRTKNLFDICPDWLPVLLSNYKMAPWHGACAWTFQTEENAPVSSLLQIRKRMWSIQTFLNLYDREDLLAHEMSHAGRMMFEEPKYEEILAYTVFHNLFYRFFGPIVQSSWESFAFVGLLILTILLDIGLLATGISDLRILYWMRAAPFALIGVGIFRLVYRQRVFKNCLRHLEQTVKKPLTALAILYRLTDKEIETFSRISPEGILDYTAKQDCLRWRAIRIRYITPLQG